MKNAIIHLLDSARGVYIPRDFIEIMKPELIAGISNDQKIDLSDPQNAFYWDTWTDIENSFQYIDDEGNEYNLYHDGDLWLVCYDLLSDEERQNFGFDY